MFLEPLSPKDLEIFSCEGPKIFAYIFNSQSPYPLHLIQVISQVLFLEVVSVHGELSSCLALKFKHGPIQSPDHPSVLGILPSLTLPRLTPLRTKQKAHKHT